MKQQPLLFQSEKSDYKVEALCKKMGDDILLSIWGGVAHIGAVAMAQPRASLKDPAKRSATASVFSYVGHKEDQLVKAVSERMASELDAKVVVAAGLHWDHITPSGIEQIIRNVNDLVTEIIQKINST